MFLVIFWTALVRYTWLSNSSRFFFPTISTFGCFWSQWPTSLAVTSGREGVRTTSFKPWRPHRGSCRGATAIEENNGSRRCGAGGCRREATWINHALAQKTCDLGRVFQMIVMCEAEKLTEQSQATSLEDEENRQRSMFLGACSKDFLEMFMPVLHVQNFNKIGTWKCTHDQLTTCAVENDQE